MTSLASRLPTRHARIVLLAAAALLSAGGALAQQVLRAGVNPTGGGLSAWNATTGKASGMAVDLMAAVAKDAGLRVEFVPVELPRLIPSLDERAIDVIAANLLATPERGAAVDFSDAFHVSHEVLVVRADDARAYASVADLEGAPLGVQEGSAQQAAVRRAGAAPELRLYASMAEVLRDIEAGKLAAGLVGASVAREQIARERLSGVRIVESHPPLLSNPVAFGVRKGDEALLGRIDASLARLKADGTVARLRDRHGL